MDSRHLQFPGSVVIYPTELGESFFNRSLSESVEMKCGIPQRSCLDPLIYFIFTNDLPMAMNHAELVMYEDDTAVYVYVSVELNNILSEELKQVEKWIKDNKLALNVSKIVSITIVSCHSLKSSNGLNLCINKTQMFLRLRYLVYT